MLAIAGIALVGVGYAGLRQATDTQRSLVPEPLPPRQTFAVSASTTDAFSATSVRQAGLNAGFPAQPPPNGLNKDRYLDLDRGMSGTILERHTGIPVVPSRKHDPPAPYKPTPNLRTNGDTARTDQMKLYTGSMSQYRNDETPIPRTQVGPGVGYDATVPAADGFHPRLRVVSTDALTQRNPSRALPPAAPFDPVGRREADVHVSQNTTTRSFEQSVEYTTGNPSASSAGTSTAPVPRNNYEMKPTTRDTEMPALKAANGCHDIDASTSRFGIGAGPAIASGSIARVAHATYSGSESQAAVDAIRTTDRGWSGLWGVGPSAASDVPSAAASSSRDQWQSALRAQSRDATGLDPERIGQGGPSNTVGGATVAWQDTPATQGRELVPGLPVINTAPSGVSGVMHSPWTDTTVVSQHGEDSRVRAPNRASYVLNDHDSMPTAQVTGSSSERQRSAFARGRLGRATHREVIDREQFAMNAPHSGVGDMVRPNWQTFALRDATTDAFRVSGPNRGSSFESSDFAKGRLAPKWQLAVPKPDFMHDRMPNLEQRGGMAYKPPTGVQYNPNKFESPDDRLDVAIDSQASLKQLLAH